MGKEKNTGDEEEVKEVENRVENGENNEEENLQKALLHCRTTS